MNGFESSWGIESHHASEPICPSKGDYRSAIERLRDKKTCECADWLRELSGNYEGVFSASRDYQANLLERKIVVSWVTSLFKQLQKFGEQFNANLAEICLCIDFVEPEFHKVSCRETSVVNPNGIEKLFYEGHLANARNALLIRGVDAEIDIYLVPAAFLLLLSLNESVRNDFVPLMQLKVDAKLPDSVALTIAGGENIVKSELRSSSLPLIARYVFTAFINASMEGASCALEPAMVSS